MCGRKIFLAMICNEIKCHVNTSLGLMRRDAGDAPPCVHLYEVTASFSVLKF